MLLTSIIITLIFSAFFSGMEIAFISANRVRLELDNQRGGATSRILQYLYNHSERFISTMLVGNNIALIFYGILMARLLEPYIQRWITANEFMVVLIQTLSSTLLILFTAEYLPKTLFKINPNMMLRVFAFPLWAIYWILWPISSFSIWTSHRVLRLFGMPVVGQRSSGLTKVDLDFFVRQGIENAEDDDVQPHAPGSPHAHAGDDDDEANLKELQLFKNVLDFSKVKVRDCMIPRAELTAVAIDTPLHVLNRMFVETGYSKIPVYRDDIDNLVGYIHSSEMFRRPAHWQQKMISIPFVPESMAAPKVLKMLMDQKKSIAAVLDEYGDTAGVITMEDLFEEIIGDIEDEHDRVQLVERRRDDGSYELSGRLEVARINEDLGLELPESPDDYLTLAGLVLHELETMPREGDTVELDEVGIRLTVLKVSATKVELIGLEQTGAKE